MKSNKFEPARIRNIQEWLLQGQLVTDILRNIISKWELNEESGLEHIAEAFADFTQKVKKDYGQTKAYHVQLRLNLYKKAMEDKEYQVALKVLQDLAKIEDVG